MITAAYPETLSGYLIAAGDEKTEISREILTSCAALKFRGEMHTRWEEYVLRSERPLLGEDEEIYPGPFEYLLIMRRSGARLLVLSGNRRIVESFVKKNGESIGTGVASMEIFVDRLVKAMVEGHGVYKLSFAHARVTGFGNSLRAMSLYGDDLADARLFRQHLPNMTFYSCGLRGLIEGLEILRLGTEGQVSFLLPRDQRQRSQRLDDVLEVLRFLSREEMLRVRPPGFYSF